LAQRLAALDLRIEQLADPEGHLSPLRRCHRRIRKIALALIGRMEAALHPLQIGALQTLCMPRKVLSLRLPTVSMEHHATWVENFI
jgi:hypothetical protein